MAENEDVPVYDERGNVRPRGTEGARPMSWDERVELAKEQDRGGEVVGDMPTPESDPVKPEATDEPAPKRSRKK